MLKKKNKLCMQIMLLSIQNTHPYFEWNCLIVTGKFFSRNQMKTRQENVDF